MAKVINSPKMGNTVESIILGDIKIKVGDKIKPGDVLFEYETDKSSTEFKSEDSGVVLKILYESGDEVLVLTPIIIIGEKGEDISKLVKEFKNSSSNKIEIEKIKSNNESLNKEIPIKESTTLTAEENHDFHLSPRARKTAEHLSVDVNSIVPEQSINGRVSEKDVLNSYYKEDEHLENNKNNEFKKVQYSPIRKAIARSMESSLQHGAQLTLMAPFDATSLLTIRNKIKTKLEKKKDVVNSSINDLIVYVTSRVLTKFPEVNSIIGEDYYLSYKVAHIAIAVDTTRGLFVPVLKNVSNLSMREITDNSKKLIQATRDAKLSISDQTGGTFTISNLGLSGVMGFTPILNPPQAAILGVGSPITRLKLKDKTVVEYKEIVLSLTMDHRPFDGAKGSEFLKTLINELENLSFDKITWR